MAIAMETVEEEEEEEEEEEMIKLGNLSNYIVESIFSKIPLKSLIQLKTVSKTWRNSITNIRHCYPPTTSTGLVLFLKHKTYQESIFMKLHDQKGSRGALKLLPCMGSNEPKFCTFHASCVHKFPFLIDSCNGVLLYGSHNNVFWTYTISSPVLDQFVTLPVSHHVTRPACSSLVFDGWHDEFQIICFFWEEVDLDSELVSCMMFSSNSWNWRENKLRILNSELLLVDGFVKGQCFGNCVFSVEEKRLYCIWSLCLLVYDIDEEFFTLFSLPKNHTRKGVYSQLLWESEGGGIQFCDPVNNGFFIWTFNGNDFKLENYVRLEDLRLRKMGYSVKPCAFNKDLEVLYLHVLPHTIVSYSFETRELVRVWSYCCNGDAEEEEDCWIFKIHPFVFSSVDLLAFNELRQVD